MKNGTKKQIEMAKNSACFVWHCMNEYGATKEERAQQSAYIEALESALKDAAVCKAFDVKKNNEDRRSTIYGVTLADAFRRFACIVENSKEWHCYKVNGMSAYDIAMM